MTVEPISLINLNDLTHLSIELWPECDFEEELQNWKSVLMSSNQICLLAKYNNAYIGFIHLSIRMIM
jgi:aminoglycoside 6'-N-acetyltransferase I